MHGANFNLVFPKDVIFLISRIAANLNYETACSISLTCKWLYMDVEISHFRKEWILREAVNQIVKIGNDIIEEEGVCKIQCGYSIVHCIQLVKCDNDFSFYYDVPIVYIVEPPNPPTNRSRVYGQFTLTARPKKLLTTGPDIPDFTIRAISGRIIIR